MAFSKKTTPLHSTHSTELFKIFFSLLTLSTAFLQKGSGPEKIDIPTAIAKESEIYLRDRETVSGYVCVEIEIGSV